MQRLQDIAATFAILAGLALMVLAVSPAHAGCLIINLDQCASAAVSATEVVKSRSKMSRPE